LRAGKLEFVDAELARLLHRDDAFIRESNLEIARRAGAEHILVLDCGTESELYRFVTAYCHSISGGEQNAADIGGVVGSGDSQSEQKEAARIAFHGVSLI